MNRLLRHPATNAICLSIFTAFYASIFIITSSHTQFRQLLYYHSAQTSIHPFWMDWSNFLAAGHQAYIAYALILVTVFIVAMLLLRRRTYDEYHTTILLYCLAVACVLTLIAIAIFYVAILRDMRGILEKFTLFIFINWVTVVLSDLSFVMLCRWR